MASPKPQSTPVFGVGSLSNYHNLTQVGEGGYGYVYRALDARGQTVALKRMIIHKEHLGFPLCAVREIKFLKQLSHKNIVKLKDIVTSKGCEQLDLSIKADSKAKLEQSKSQDRMLDMARQEQSSNVDKSREKEMEERVEEAIRQQREREFRSKVLSQCASLYLVFEYVEHDLGGLIDAKYQFQPRALKSMMKQIFEVLDYLEEKHIIHRDIKCSNILVSDRHQIKLADFGLARSAALPDGREGKIDMTNNVVTRWYKSPELLLGSTRYTYAVDMWSAGCVLAELYLEKPLFPGNTEVQQLDLIFRTMGSPSEQDWPGILDLPHYDKLYKHSPRFLSTFRASLNGKVPDVAMGLLDRVFVMDPSRRCSARAALTSKYFMVAPVAPDDPTELEPLQVAAGANLHEYSTKQRRKELEKQKEKQKEQEAAGPVATYGGTSSVSYASLPPPPVYTMAASRGGASAAGYIPHGQPKVTFGNTGGSYLPPPPTYASAQAMRSSQMYAPPAPQHSGYHQQQQVYNPSPYDGGMGNGAGGGGGTNGGTKRRR